MFQELFGRVPLLRTSPTHRVALSATTGRAQGHYGFRYYRSREAGLKFITFVNEKIQSARSVREKPSA